MLWTQKDRMAPDLYRGRRFAVFRASGEGTGPPLVVKTVQPGPLAASSSAMLCHEYAILRALDAPDVPGVVKPLDLGEVAGMPALFLEDAGPHTLKEWLRRKPLGVDTFLVLALQLAATVEALHRRHVIHRDLNPANIIVAADSQHLTLVDFDSSTQVAGLAHAPGIPAEFQGTLPYIAPEQTGRMNRLVDHRADLYSLGATLYELLTGAPPFVSTDPAELVHAHLARPPVSPSSVHPAVPEALSGIVLKLLAKMPEERYQSAESLRLDLLEAQRRWRGAGRVGPFELGRHDIAQALIVPETLYGREHESAALWRALERARSGASARVLVEGPAGIGKSTLVERLRRKVEDEGQGRFISGKFDELHGNLPYAPLLEAFRRLLRTLLATPAGLPAWKRSLREALGTNARVLTDVLPELEQLLGRQPPVPTLEPLESENRFLLTFQAFVQALAEEARPLVLFLDDLQWADSASLRLLRGLAMAPDLHHVLLVCAFRDEELKPGHPLARALADIAGADALVEHLHLAPLDTEALTALCAEALRSPPERVRPLATRVWQKTAGNPFFVGRFLRHLHQAGLLTYDVERGAWEWDLAGVERSGVTENVVELMVLAIRRLPERTQRVLKVAACFRDRVDLWLLSALVDQPAGETAGALWSALREGLLVPQGEGPRFTRPQDVDAPLVQEASYRFVHDRVRQAAYSLLSRDERQVLHLQLGRRLGEALSESEPDERLFEVVDHLNLGAAGVKDAAERLRLAGLNARAGRRARAAAAFGPALAYLTRGLELLPQDAWRSHPELALRLHREAAECAYATGHHARAEALIQEALAHTASRFEQADLYNLLVLACTAHRAYSEAFHWGRQGLRLFGLELPEHDVPEALSAELAEVERNRRGRSLEELLAAAPMHESEQLACVRLLASLGSPAFFSNPALFSFIRVRTLNLTLQHGNTPDASLAYVSYGMILAERTGDYATGHAFGRLGVELARRCGDPRLECRALTLFAVYVNHWREPLRASVPLLRRAFAAGLETGEFQFAAYSGAGGVVATLFHMGAELSRVLEEARSALLFTRKAGQWSMADLISVYRQASRCLQGQTRERARYDDEDFDERQFLDSIQDFPFNRCHYAVLRLQTSYLLGDLADARRMSEAAAGQLLFIRGFFAVAAHTFYSALTLAALCDGASPEERAGLLERLSVHQQQLGRWAESCPENFRHKHQLVRAEVARLQGQHLEALELYEKAAEGARQQEFCQDEALANELAGRHHRALGRQRFATLCLRAALEGFARWGATAKVQALEEEFPDLAPSEALASPLVPARGEERRSALDLLGLLKAAEMLSSEVFLGRLLEKLMGVCIEVGGAQRGALVQEEEGALVVRAVGAVGEPVSLERTPMESSGLVPATVIAHAHRTGEAIVLADAAHQGRFSSDAYVAEHGLRSALAVPIRRGAQPRGVLYLENNLATRAFTPERVRVLQLLSSQMAIALENSRLFEELKVEVEERRRAEETVRFLSESSLVLAESLDYPTTLERVARLAVPFLADTCMVDVVEPEGRIRRVAVAHVEPEKEGLLRELREKYPPDWDSPQPAALALRSGRPYLLSKVAEAEILATCRDARHVELIRGLGLRTGMAVPLVARGKTVGAITFGLSAPGREYGEADLELAQELARRAALFIDNARLYGESQEAIRLREEFLTVAAHELYTPLTSLKLAVQGLRRRAGPSLPESLASPVQSAERQMQRLTRLVGELLDVSRIQSGRLHLNLEEVDLAALVREGAERFQEGLEQAGCPLRLRAEGPVVGRWDRTRLEQVVTNLLSNALKFGAGKPIEVTVEEREGRARLVVRDYGIGISAERLPHIFGRFERAVSAREYGGLGLGLYIVREILSALGGSVRVESTPGSGTTFTVELPCAGPPDEAPVRK
ncbi:ATP-binding sensor histidine kinase [Myxococcus sp. RHSTA-1-4]|uniref:ATP-binding sensor histidine kinase n=1 Tax=Myxococcus sp. RHSTA-1-4 TaxID=2874601 RepID=UPI00272EBB95|nr:ATP-binding sensor histidine kinase [Myxococcus sp. RHSTA-1-4]MBZ4421747.1 AAA family ATPase [Myxococcus sp. RHSTA-1-4]